MAISSTNWRLVPLLIPAVEKRTCNLDHDLLTNRVGAVGAIAFALLTAAFILQINVFSPFTPFFPISMCVIATIAIPILVLDHLKSGWVADQKAVNEYLTLPYPSKSATERISQNLSAAKLLVSQAKKENNCAEILNKEHQENGHLLDRCDYQYSMTSDVFKLLVSNGADLSSKDEYGTSYFRRLVTSKENVAYERLEWVVNEKIVKPSHLDKEEQVLCWLSVNNEDTGQLLVQKGFNPNIESPHKDGELALVRLAKRLDNPTHEIQNRVNILNSCIQAYHKKISENNN